MTPQDLRAWRRELNVNCKTLGALLGCSGRSIEAYEQGRKIPAPMVKLMEMVRESLARP